MRSNRSGAAAAEASSETANKAGAMRMLVPQRATRERRVDPPDQCAHVPSGAGG